MTHTQTHTRLFYGPLDCVSRYQKQSGLYWSKRQRVAVASDGPYADLYLFPDR